MIKNMKVAFLAANGFEQSELLEPKKALENEGAEVTIISPEKNVVKGWTKNNWGEEVQIDVNLNDANPDDYDALVLPGGVMNPDKLRINENAINFIKHFILGKKPIAAICHGSWPLIEADGVKGRKMTSWPSLQSDLTNAGAKWVNQEVVRDGMLITSRKPDDLPAFNKEIIELLNEVAGKEVAT
jgi:protease I